jgi:hypothetical protein
MRAAFGAVRETVRSIAQMLGRVVIALETLIFATQGRGSR